MLDRFLSALRRVVSVRSNAATIETMESRTLLSVSLSSAGYTTVTPAAGDRVIYCSSSAGNDKNSGLSASAPVKTLARAESLMRNGYGDEMLLKAGDIWTTNIGVWGKSGQSTSNPMVIGSYGSGARPTIYSQLYAGFLTVNTPVSNLDVLGINFDSNLRDPKLTKSVDTAISPTGFDFQTGGSNDLVENCEFQNYAVNINIQAVSGTPTNITIRRNIVVNAWAIHGHAEGIYVLGTHGINIIGNDFDHNGYSDTIPYAGMNIYNHDAYLSYDNTGVVVKDNTFSRAACTGLQARSGGIIENNLFVNNPVDMTFGLVNGAHTTAGGVTGIVSGNVFTGGENIGSLQQGIGLEVGNINRSGATISSNVFYDGETNSGPAMMLCYGSGLSNPTQAVGINNVSISNNVIYNWHTGIQIENGQVAGGYGLTAFNHVTFTGNEFENIAGLSVEQSSSLYSQETWSGNEYYDADVWYINYQHAKPIGTVLSKPITFPAPSRTVTTYDASLTKTIGSVTDFYTREAAQSAASFNASLDAQAVVAYLAGGFGK